VLDEVQLLVARRYREVVSLWSLIRTLDTEWRIGEDDVI